MAAAPIEAETGGRDKSTNSTAHLPNAAGIHYARLVNISAATYNICDSSKTLFQCALMSKITLCLTFILSGAEVNWAAQREVGTGEPYRTISSAITAAAPNDVINIHGGTFTENPVINRALTLKANAGDQPKIVGWISVTASNVRIDGLEVTGWSGSLNGIDQEQMQVLSGLTVSNCKVHAGRGAGTPIDVGRTNDPSAGIRVRNSSNTHLMNNEVYGCFKGVRVDSSRAADRSSIARSYDTGTIIFGNNIHDCKNDGINIHGQYFTISNNTINNCVDSQTGGAPGLAGGVGYHADGIQLIAGIADGMSTVQHCRILRNTFHNTTQNVFTEGMSTALGGSSGGEGSDCADILIANNVSFNDNGGTVNGYNFSLGSATTKGFMVKWSRDVYIYNNTVIGGTVGAAIQNCKDGSVHIKNNIWANSRTLLYIENPPDTASGEVDYNDYFKGAIGTNVIAWGTTFYPTLTAFKTAVRSEEAHGISVDPLVSSGLQPVLASASPVRGKGVNLFAVCPADRNGNLRSSSGPWDIGAYALAGISPPTNLTIVK